MLSPITAGSLTSAQAVPAPTKSKTQKRTKMIDFLEPIRLSLICQLLNINKNRINGYRSGNYTTITVTGQKDAFCGPVEVKICQFGLYAGIALQYINSRNQ